MFNISDNKQGEYSLPIKVLSKDNKENKFINFNYKRVGYVNWFFKDVDLMYYYASTKIYKIIEFNIFNNNGVYAINTVLVRDKDALKVISHPAHLYGNPQEIMDRILSFAYECGDYTIVQRDDELLTRVRIQYSDKVMGISYYNEINERILKYYKDDYNKYLKALKIENLLYNKDMIPYGTYTLKELYNNQIK